MIETLLNQKMKKTEIAIQLSRNKTTIYKCIKKYTNEDGVFEANEVWEKIRENRRNRAGFRKILSDEMLRKYVLEKIEVNWSPEQIAGRWNEKTGKVISHENKFISLCMKIIPSSKTTILDKKGKSIRRTGKRSIH